MEEEEKCNVVEVKKSRLAALFAKDSKWRVAFNLLLWVLFYFLFIYIGGLIINAIEKNNDLKLKKEKRTALLEILKKFNISTDSKMLHEIMMGVVEAHDVGGVDFQNVTRELPSSWSLASAVFFCSTVVTTIGYGNIVPVTNGGKVFTIFYAIFGIPFTGIVLTKIGGIFTTFIKRWDDFLSIYIRKGIGKFERDELKIKLYVRIGQLVFTIFIIILFFWIIPAAIMLSNEDWNYLDSLYFCFISLTTIGLGDLVPTSSTSHVEFKKMELDDAKAVTIQISTLLYLLAGLSMITIVISLGTSLANIIAESAIEHAGDLVTNNGMKLMNNIKQKANNIAPSDVKKSENKIPESKIAEMMEEECKQPKNSGSV